MNRDVNSHDRYPMTTASQPVNFSNLPGQSSVKRSLRGNESCSPPSGDDSEDEITYPEGGVAAWTVAVGSWCSMTAGLGIVNSTGVFEAYVSNTILSSSSANAVGWIFGIYVFVSYFCGIQIGPVFDARGPRELILIGTICLLVGTFTLGQCTSELLSKFSLSS